MSFWSDATPATKGVIVVGPVLILVALLYNFGVFGGGDEAPAPERGLPPPAEAAP